MSSLVIASCRSWEEIKSCSLVMSTFDSTELMGVRIIKHGKDFIGIQLKLKNRLKKKTVVPIEIIKNMRY